MSIILYFECLCAIDCRKKIITTFYKEIKKNVCTLLFNDVLIYGMAKVIHPKYSKH
jgi:hypothetical protein